MQTWNRARFQELVPLINTQLHAIRSVLGSGAFLELLPQQLEPFHATPFKNGLRVSFSPGSCPAQAVLQTAPDAYLLLALPAVGRTYCITTSFREDRWPSTSLLEFRYVQATGDGTLNDAMALVESLVRGVIQEVAANGFIPRDRATDLARIQYPLARIEHSDALAAVQKSVGDTLTRDDYLSLLQHYGSSPFFVVGFPPEAEPRAFDAARYKEHGRSKMRYFELIAPFCAELATGREMAATQAELLSQAKGSLFIMEAMKAGLTDAALSRYVDAMGRIKPPAFTIGVGFERLTQYLAGKSSAEDATLYPVTLTTLTPSGELFDVLFNHGAG